MEAPRFDLVPFRDGQILAARAGDTVLVPMRRFCETLGLPWEPQRKRIARDEVLSEGASMMEVPSAGGVQAQTVLPLDLIPGFLFGADASRYAPELRQRVRTFRRECFAVLHGHFFGQQPAVALPSTPAPALLAEARREGRELIALIKAETHPVLRAHYHALLEQSCADLALPAPPIEIFARTAPGPAEILAPFLEGLKVLDGRRVKWNHARGATGRLAVNLPEIARLFARHDIDVAVDEDLRTALAQSTANFRIRSSTIASTITGKPVYCWILEPWPFEGAPA